VAVYLEFKRSPRGGAPLLGEVYIIKHSPLAQASWSLGDIACCCYCNLSFLIGIKRLWRLLHGVKQFCVDHLCSIVYEV
jgi:hypothetical protein